MRQRQKAFPSHRRTLGLDDDIEVDLKNGIFKTNIVGNPSFPIFKIKTIYVLVFKAFVWILTRKSIYLFSTKDNCDN